MSTTEKTTTAKGLAWRIAVAFETVDPYSFNDAYDNTREAAFCMLELLEEDPDGVLEWLENELEYYIADDAPIRAEVEGICSELEKLTK